MIKNIDGYTLKKQNIGKIDTYVISPEHYNEFLDALNDDDELIEGLDHVDSKRKYTEDIIMTVNRIRSVKLYLAINHNGYAPADRFSWYPMICLKMGDDFYPVKYIASWRCRDCMGDNGEVFVPLVDMESDYFWAPRTEFTKIKEQIRAREPKVFHHLFCKHCGRMMSGYLMKLP